MASTQTIRFGPWILGELLGVGGFAEVRRAIPVAGGPPVAVKRLLPMLVDVPAARRAFTAELAALTRVQSPEIVGLIADGECRRLPWLALELIDGLSLTQLLRDGPFCSGGAAALLHDMAGALVACHAAAVLHGDVAPGNLVVDSSGCGRLIDFGLATSPAVPERHHDAGTPAFMDPETAQNQPRSAASDLFSLALVWVRLRTGASALGGGSPLDRRRNAANCSLAADVVERAMVGLPEPLAGLWRTSLSRNSAAAAPAEVRAAEVPAAEVTAAKIAAALRPLLQRVPVQQRLMQAQARVASLAYGPISSAEGRGEVITDRSSDETATSVGVDRIELPDSLDYPEPA